VTFEFLACDLRLSARRSTRFPPWKAGNVLRGALGHFLQSENRDRLFRPVATGNGPSGLADWPRPFVIHALSLNGRQFAPGDEFCFRLNWFGERERLSPVIDAFGAWAKIVSADVSMVSINLDASQVSTRIRVDFQTPTDLRTPDAGFDVLLSRARDRVSTLRALYGAGPLDIDFRGMAERARAVTTVRSELLHVTIQRRSSRTGQRHGIGGFTGFAEYAGDLGEFMPILEAAYWTGVGRHCSWGNGQISTAILDSVS
jgi:hypothetical protein